MNDKINILGIPLDPLNRYQALQKVEEFSLKNSSSVICTVNVEFIMTSKVNNEFEKVLKQKSALNLMDGSGVVWAARFLTSWAPKSGFFRQAYIILQWLIYVLFYPLTSSQAAKRFPKLSGSDFVWDICQWASDNHKSIFILGNKNGLDPNAVQKASLELQTKIFDLNIVGTRSSTPDAVNEKVDIEAIKKSGADILFCAFGSAAQEIWLAKNLGRSGAKIGVGLGGTFDFIAGVQKRAPRFIRNIGLEWLYRLIWQPRRIKRQMALPKFAYQILKERLSANN